MVLPACEKIMTRQFCNHWTAILPCLLAGAVLSTQSQAQEVATDPPAETVELSYAPEEGSLFDVTETFTRVTTTGDQDPVTDEMERKSRVLVTCTDDGFANTVMLVSQTLKRNDNLVASPVLAATKNLNLTYNLSKDGEMISIAGYDQLPQKMTDLFAEQMASTMIRLLNTESLKLRDEEAYKHVYGDLIGKSVTVGEETGSAVAQPMPYGGSKTLYSVDESEKDTGGTLTLTRTYNSDSTALSGDFDSIEATTLETAATNAGVTDMIPDSHASASITGEASTEISSSELLIKSQAVTMTYTLSINDPDGGEPVSVTIEDKSEYEVAAVETEMMAAASEQ